MYGGLDVIQFFNSFQFPSLGINTLSSGIIACFQKSLIILVRDDALITDRCTIKSSIVGRFSPGR